MRLLLVEDNAINMEIARMILTQVLSGHRDAD